MKWLVCLLFLLAMNAQAKPVLTANCTQPIGQRYDQVDGSVQQKKDGFDGVSPIFIIDDQRPKVLTYIWGPAEWARDALKLKAAAQEAVIVSISEDKITAIHIESENIIRMYSLFPKRGLVLLSQHRYIDLAGGVPTVGMFYSKCNFSS